MGEVVARPFGTEPGAVATGSNTQRNDDGKSRTIDGLETNARFARPTRLDGWTPSLPIRVLYQGAGDFIPGAVATGSNTQRDDTVQTING